MQAVSRLCLPAFALLAALVLGASPAVAGGAESAEQKVEKARSLMSQVREETDDWGLWKSTREILGNAEKSLENGDHQAAQEAAEKVIFQAQKGLAQYRKQNPEEAAEAAAAEGDLQEASWTEGEG